MKKLIRAIFCILTILFVCSGCDAEITRGIRHAGFNVSESKFVCSPLVSKMSSKSIRYLGSNFAIDNAGIVYEISLDQVYSNKQNCKKSSLPTTVSAIMDEQVVRGVDGRLYYLVAGNPSQSYSEITKADSALEVYRLLFGDPEVVKIITINQNEGVFYVLRTDGNIYKYIIARDNSKDTYSIISKEVVFSNETFGKIIDFNYNNASKNTSYIRSVNSLYRWKITNYAECSKYADKECIYVRYRDDELMRFDDRILGFNGSLLITDYGREFTVAY